VDVDDLVSCDTGWRLSSNGGIVGPGAGHYRLIEGVVHGSCAGGQYAFDSAGRLLDGSSITGFYVHDGKIHGPSRVVPWVAAREALTTLLEAARRMPSRGTDCVYAQRALLQALFMQHALPYQALEQGSDSGMAIVRFGSADFLVGANTSPWDRRDAATIRSFARAAHARGIGALYFSLRNYEPELFEFVPDSGSTLLTLIDGDEVQAVAKGSASLVDILETKLKASAKGRVYQLVR
jgi:hypothetical protein